MRKYRIEGTRGTNNESFTKDVTARKNCQQAFLIVMRQIPDYHFDSLRGYRLV